jgi:hypothetical protein
MLDVFWQIRTGFAVDGRYNSRHRVERLIEVPQCLADVLRCATGPCYEVKGDRREEAKVFRIKPADALPPPMF